jgi:hypothetical protein
MHLGDASISKSLEAPSWVLAIVLVYTIFTDSGGQAGVCQLVFVLIVYLCYDVLLCIFFRYCFSCKICFGYISDNLCVRKLTKGNMLVSNSVVFCRFSGCITYMGYKNIIIGSGGFLCISELFPYCCVYILFT